MLYDLEAFHNSFYKHTNSNLGQAIYDLQTLILSLIFLKMTAENSIAETVEGSAEVESESKAQSRTQKKRKQMDYQKVTNCPNNYLTYGEECKLVGVLKGRVK